MNHNKRLLVTLSVGSLFLLCASYLAGCGTSVGTPSPAHEVTTKPSRQPPSETASISQIPATSTLEFTTPDPAAIQVAWQGSPHADSYVLDKAGQNNTCARCHAPINWMPTMDDLPESCFACKFELEEPPQTIAESEWTNIPCKICHKVDKKDVVQPEYAWLSIAPLDEYTKVASPTELCMKCHATEGIAGHGIIQLLAAHADYECTRCHPAHETTASCDLEGCHPTLDKATTPIPGHDQAHQAVSCVACHDGSGLVVGPNEKTGLWITFMSSPSNGDTEMFAFTSHNVVLEAKCDRCHFIGNPWGISDTVEIP